MRGLRTAVVVAGAAALVAVGGSAAAQSRPLPAPPSASGSAPSASGSAASASGSAASGSPAPVASAPKAGPATASVSATATSPSVARITGPDRYATSVAASRAAFPTGTRPDVVYLVSGTSPWESLSATPAAVKRDGGVLLTPADGIPPTVTGELRRLRPASIVVVGSPTTLSDTVLRQARGYAPNVRRVAGSNRFGTAQALVRDAFPAGSATRAWVATGRGWTDGLVAGAAAAAQRSPLLTVDGAAPALSSGTVALLRSLGVVSVTIAGSTAGVSRGIEAQLDGILGPGHVTRASGADPYAVSTRVNQLAFPQSTAGTAYVANGRSFVNALAGAFLAGRTRRPLYYTVPFCVPRSVRPALTAASVTRLAVLGGEESVRSLVTTLEGCRSTTTPSSPWVLVNKRNALRPRTYVPTPLAVPRVTHANGERLRRDAAAALARMFSTAASSGHGRMAVASGYRSYRTQYSVYRNRVSTNGRAYADRWIARPGFSEHQTGLSLDIAPVGNRACRSHTCLGSTPQGAWLRRNAWRFGFVLRYESGYTSVTGYGSEPWHFRYVGTPLAAAYHKGGWHTLEQFLDEPPARTY